MKLSLFALIFCVAAGFACDEKDKLKQEQQKLAGTWKVKSAELGGKAMSAELTKSWSLTLTDDKYIVMVGTMKDEGSVTIDLEKSPPTMDIKGENGPNKGKTMLAIYELKDDTLKVCYDLAGKTRPTEFESKADSKRFFVTYTREKK